MKGSILRVLFQRHNDEPIIKDVIIKKKLADGSIDVETTEEIFLSNGDGPMYDMDLFNLKMDDMTVRYYNILPKYMKESIHFTKFMIAFLRTPSSSPQEWKQNVPTWKPYFYRETCLATILCLKKMNIFPKELIKMIAEYVYESRHDMCWFPQIQQEETSLVQEPERKKLKRRIKKKVI
jgi:hypothetical protein